MSISTDLPKEIAGKWVADNSRWIFEISDEGELTKIRHFVGMEIDMREGLLVEKLGDEGEATYILGPSEVKYDPKNQELSVKVTIQYFQMIWPNGGMRGSFEDILVGKINFNGFKWYPRWKSQSTIWSDEQNESDAVSITDNQEIFSKVQN